MHKKIRNFIRNSYEEFPGAKKVDAILMIDESVSMRNNYNEAKCALKNWVRMVMDNPEYDSRVALIRFASGTREEFDFDKYSNTEDIIDHIDDMKYAGGRKTCSNKAFDKARTIFRRRRNRSRRGKYRIRLTVLVTDGKANCGGSACPAAERLHKDDVAVFVTGIGKRIRPSEIECMASDELFYNFVDEYGDICVSTEAGYDLVYSTGAFSF